MFHRSRSYVGKEIVKTKRLLETKQPLFSFLIKEYFLNKSGNDKNKQYARNSKANKF